MTFTFPYLDSFFLKIFSKCQLFVQKLSSRRDSKTLQEELSFANAQYTTELAPFLANCLLCPNKHKQKFTNMKVETKIQGKVKETQQHLENKIQNSVSVFECSQYIQAKLPICLRSKVRNTLHFMKWKLFLFVLLSGCLLEQNNTRKIVIKMIWTI